MMILLHVNSAQLIGKRRSLVDQVRMVRVLIKVVILDRLDEVIAFVRPEITSLKKSEKVFEKQRIWQGGGTKQTETTKHATRFS